MCLVAAARRTGHWLAVVLLHSSDPQYQASELLNASRVCGVELTDRCGTLLQNAGRTVGARRESLPLTTASASSADCRFIDYDDNRPPIEALRGLWISITSKLRQVVDT